MGYSFIWKSLGEAEAAGGENEAHLNCIRIGGRDRALKKGGRGGKLFSQSPQNSTENQNFSAEKF